MINMTKIDYVINITGASYDIVRKALLDSDGDVDVAISYIREGKYDVNIDPSSCLLYTSDAADDVYQV